MMQFIRSVRRELIISFCLLAHSAFLVCFEQRCLQNYKKKKKKIEPMAAEAVGKLFFQNALNLPKAQTTESKATKCLDKTLFMVSFKISRRRF